MTNQQHAPVTYTAAQSRVMAAALQLFSAHGVSGTSLQMIARQLGVTKAAVYHQFNSKEEIVIAAASLIVDSLRELVALAASQTTPKQTREVLLTGLIDLGVARRSSAGFFQRDPIMLQVFAEYEPFRQVMTDLGQLLLSDNSTQETYVTVAMLLTAIGGTVIHPLTADIDDAVLRQQLHHLLHSLCAFLD